MRATIYSPDDEEFVQKAAIFLSHIKSCPDCNAIAQGEGLEYVEAMFNSLNDLSDNDIPCHSYSEAIAFCRYWLNANGIPMIADHLEATRH